MRARKCKRGRGGCGRLCGRWVLAGASFGPMAAISRRGQGGRIYNNTRVRELLRRKCVKPADLTTHSPPKTSAPPPHSDTPFPSTSARHRSPDARPRSADARPQAARCTPADLTTHSPPKTSSRPRTATRPRRALPLPTQPRRTPTQRRRTPAGCAIHSPPTSQPIPRRSSPLAHAQRHALPEHFRSPTQPRRTPAGCAMHSPPTPQSIPRSATLPLLPFRFGHKKTAPHSACAMPNVSVDRRCGRSFGLVSRALFATVAGRWRVGVGLRPQPWALRSRRCGRVLRA